MSKDKRKKEPLATQMMAKIWASYMHRRYLKGAPDRVTKRLVALGLAKLERSHVSFGQSHIRHSFVKLTPAGEACIRVIMEPRIVVTMPPTKRSPRVEKKAKPAVRRGRPLYEDYDHMEDGVRAYARYIP